MNIFISLKNRLSVTTQLSSPPPPYKENDSPPSYMESSYNKRVTRNYTGHKSTPHASVNHEVVGKTFYKVLWSMKWTGLCPLTVENSGKFYSPPTIGVILYTVLTALCVTSCVTIYTLNRGFDIGWPFRLWAPLKPQEIFDSTSGTRPPPNFFVWVTLSLQIMIPVSSILYGHLGLYHISDFCTFLNRWTEYSKQFEICFSPYSYSADFADLRKYRNLYSAAYIPTMLFCIALIPIMSKTKVLQVSSESYYIVSTFITLFWVEALIGIRIIFSIKDFMILNTLEIGYRELRKGIDAQYTVLQGKVNRLHVRNWLKMVVFIRDQRKLAEKHIGFQNNCLLAEIFVVTLLVLTASIVVVMNEIHEYLGWVATYVLISVALLFFLFFKAQLAECISEQEEMLAESIVGMTGYDDCDTRLEMKSLCDLIFHDPIKITMGYVFVLNKRLMLAFCSQLAASLVILLQFVNH